MKKIYLKQVLLLFAVSLSFIGWSQIQQNPANTIVNPENCGFHSMHQQKMANDPLYFQNTVDFNTAMENYASPKVGNTTLRVPIVVHVMDDGTSLTQITDEEIRQGIQRINERFRKVPGSLGDGNGVDTELEFVLAVRDPSGNCTDGIVRYDLSGNATYTSAGVFAESAGVSDGFLKAQSFWNSSNYYNFWLVSEIDNNNGGAGIQGYAFFASAHGTATDGTVMLCNNFKSSTSTTATHELGHAFNLYHTFQGDAGGGACPPNANCNTQGDRVCDTPPHLRSVSNCVTAANACDGGSSSDLYIHNYMDYSSDACQSDFTAGQKVRITNAMTVTRASFLASNGNLSLVPPVPPVVDFTASADFFCLGNPIQFFDISSCTPNTFLDSTYWSGITFNWTFTNGVDTYNSTLQNPLINFPNAGVYDVTLTVTNAQGSNTLTQTSFFTLGNSPIAACTPSTANQGNFLQCVSNVTFNSINNTTSNFSNGDYADYTCEFNTFVIAGSTYPLDVTVNSGGSGPEVVEVYIDYNNNGTFEAGELVHSGTTGGTNASVVTNSSIVIPGTAVQNTLLRMRVIGETNTINANERNCISSYFIGDIEDYGVYIQANCTTPVIALGTTSDPSVCAGSDGTIQITGSGTGTVDWSGTASGSSGSVTLPYTITGLAAGTYSITFSTSPTCTSNTLTQTLTDPAAPTIAFGATSGPTTCNGSDGSIQITGPGAVTGNLSLSGTFVSNSGSTTLPYTFSIIIAGTYSVDFTTAAGCVSNSISITLSDPSPSVIAIGTTSDPTVCLGADGTIQITGSGTGDISWSGTATGSATGITLPHTITGLAAGTYSIDFSPSNGCGANTVSQTLTDPGAPTIAVATFSGPTTCTGTDGAIQITGSGTGDIVWSGTASGSATGIALPHTITGLAAGTYSIDFTTSTGCASNTVSQTLTDPTTPTIAVGTSNDPSVCQGADGTIQITGTGSGDVTWSGASSGSSTGVTLPFTITGLAAGTYSIVFTASTGCVSNSVSQTLTDPAAPTIAVATFVGPSTCTGTDGAIQITGSGTGDITWSGTATGSATGITLPHTITGLAAGTYSIDFTTSTGCASNSVSQTLTDPTTPTIAVGTSNDPSVCLGSDGSIQITGTGSGDVTWSGASSGSSAGITLPFTITGLAAGTYSIDFTASTGCASNTVSQTLTDPTTPTIAVGTSNDPSVCLGSDGSIQITGTGSGDISWSGTATGSATGITLPHTITGLAAGTYSIDFAASTGCASNTVSQTLTDPAPPTIAVATFVGPSTCSGTDGTIQITGSGTGDITWSGTASGSATGITLPHTITGLAAGTYSINFTTSTGCASNTISETLNDPIAPSITLGTVNNPSSCGSTNGTISLNGSGSGDVFWTGASNGSGTNISLPLGILNLGAGTYSIVFVYSNGCTSNILTQTLIDPPPPTIAVATFVGPSTCSGTDGAIQITGSGTGDISWSGTASGSATGITLPYTIAGLAAGTYSIDFTTSTGCASNTVSETLVDPSAPANPVITANGPTQFCAGGSVDLTSSYATGNVWSTTGVTQTISVSATGTFIVTHTDANGCSSTSSPTIISVNALPSAPVITPSGSTTLCVGQTVDLSSSEATGNVWSTSDITQSITVSATGTYDVTYTDANGCSATSVPITVNGGNQPTVSGGSNATVCENEMVTLTGSGAQTYVWDGGITDNVAFTPPTGTTTYTVIGTDANGCADTAMVDVTVSPTPTVSLTTDATTCVYYAPSILVGTPAGGIFSGPNVSGNQFDPVSAGIGTHTVYYEFENADGCVGQTNTTIIVEACASLDDLTDNDAKVYPNPTQDLLNIKLTGTFNVSLFDSRGRLVYTGTGTDSLIISTLDYEAGVYILNISNEINNSVIRIVKQ